MCEGCCFVDEDGVEFGLVEGGEVKMLLFEDLYCEGICLVFIFFLVLVCEVVGLIFVDDISIVDLV